MAEPDVPPPPPKFATEDEPEPAPTKKKKTATTDDAPPIPDGRAYFVGFVSEAWQNMLRAMNEGLLEAGIKPIPDPLEPGKALADAAWLRQAMEATVDQFLPKGFKASPPMVSLVATTAITGQYWIKGRARADAARAKKAKDANTTPTERVRDAAEKEAAAKDAAKKADLARAEKIQASTGTPNPSTSSSSPPPPEPSPPPPPVQPTAPEPTVVIPDRVINSRPTRAQLENDAARLLENPDAVF